MNYNSSGSIWHRWDLHFHTPASFDYKDRSITNEQIVDRLIKDGVRVVAVTDHHKMDVSRIRKLQQLGGNRLTVLPAMELRDDHGGKPVNYICIFPEDCDLDHVWTTLQGGLGLTATAVQQKGGDHKIYVPIEEGAKWSRQLGGVVSIHAGAKSNSIEEIQNKEQFQQRIKYDITKQWVDLMEVGQLKDIDIHLSTIFPATGIDKPLIVCSDNHNISDYETKAPLWFRADPTFRGLLMVLHEPRDRVFMGQRPPEVIRIEQNPTKYVRGISFVRRSDASPDGQWFNGTIPFNPGLVAIIGNKGSGKSALADTVGLLGATKNCESFSFLSKERFKHPVGGRARDFEATLEWHSGELITRCLDAVIEPQEVERVKYLPQDHVENVCNELVGIGEQGFERELKSVIFSHVPDAQRLGLTTLDELVQFQASEKQKRIDSLLKQLKEASRSRALLEAKTDPALRRELEEKIKRRHLELEAHENVKPLIKENPSENAVVSEEGAVLLKSLEEAEAKKTSINDSIAKTNDELGKYQRRQAVAKRLIEKLENFRKDFEVFKASLTKDAAELDISPEDLASLTINSKTPDTIRNAAGKKVKELMQTLDATEATGLSKQLVDVEMQIAELQSKLDAPNRAYQAYLKDLADWEERKTKIEGTSSDSDTLAGLKSSLSALEQVPAKIEEARALQVNLAIEIHTEKIAQAEIYRILYGPVQDFINSHPLAKDKLKLEFRAELTKEDFSTRLLNLLALNRRGSFMGIDEGRAKADSLADVVKWESKASVRDFLEKVDTALHYDQRDSPPSPALLKDQILKGVKIEEVYDFLYGLEYVRPRYILRWEGKDLSMLSPGERGTLLLVFYLLIDKGDMPLVIDQPEGNLDNHTVAKVLVDCIKEARKRRQVFIVTHNPNLAVVCDADQVVHAAMDKAHGNAITYTAGSLENPAMSSYVTDVLEGTRWAFEIRGNKYTVSEIGPS